MTKLGIPAIIQQHCLPYLETDQNRNISFSFGDGYEIFGPGRHWVPVTQGLWFAGALDDPGIRHLIIGHSAMELIAFLTLHRHLFDDLNRILLVATGSGLHSSQLSLIRDSCEGKSCAFIFGKDLFGRIADLKAAASLRKLPVSISLRSDECLTVIFRSRHFVFTQNSFSLNAFERSSGFRFRIHSYKPKSASSYLHQLERRA
ncbi:hypothetical protein ABDD95_19270 [Mucilaginibacter sp. PAMB04274]|uniref:hypothetical protein n=1 Tax=Mucilaginibacter sp. PAMB04274 TaxID=3138568 RepID=UPI0031F6D283